jgi:hypothetical protein
LAYFPKIYFNIILSPTPRSPAFYGARGFITVFTSARHWSWGRWIQSQNFHPIYPTTILTLYSYLRLGLPSGIFFPGFPAKILHAFLIPSMRATCHAHLILLYLITHHYEPRVTHCNWYDLGLMCWECDKAPVFK